MLARIPGHRALASSAPLTHTSRLAGPERGQDLRNHPGQGWDVVLQSLDVVRSPQVLAGDAALRDP